MAAFPSPRPLSCRCQTPCPPSAVSLGTWCCYFCFKCLIVVLETQNMKYTSQYSPPYESFISLYVWYIFLLPKRLRLTFFLVMQICCRWIFSALVNWESLYFVIVFERLSFHWFLAGIVSGENSDVIPMFITLYSISFFILICLILRFSLSY